MKRMSIDWILAFDIAFIVCAEQLLLICGFETSINND